LAKSYNAHDAGTIARPLGVRPARPPARADPVAGPPGAAALVTRR
jgi:hypothetical protein